MRFVRAGARGAGGIRLQEWRSDLTGRVFEIDERDAYATAEALRPGDRGYLAFVGGTGIVTRRRGDPAPQPGSRSRRQRPGGTPPASSRRSGWLWLIVAAAVLVALLRLLR